MLYLIKNVIITIEMTERGKFMDKKYLNEEKYQKTRKKIIIVGLIIMGIGLLIGGLLIAKGFSSKNNNTEKTKLNSQIVEKEYECDSLEMGSPNWFADSTKCQREVSAFKSQLSDLERKAFGGTAFFIFGSFSILFGLMIGGSVISIAYKRNILAYAAQSVVPVSKEVIDEMAPTIGNAAKEIAKGIKKGLKDEE